MSDDGSRAATGHPRPGRATAHCAVGCEDCASF
jgi:hypothetical protein